MYVTAPAEFRETISSETISGSKKALATNSWEALAFQLAKRGFIHKNKAANLNSKLARHTAVAPVVKKKFEKK